MKSPYVSELQPGQMITTTFLVLQKDIRQKKTGEPYLSLTLGDRTGDLDAKMWDNCAEILETFDRDNFVRARGLVQVHQNRLQLTLNRVQRIEESEIDFTDYFPASSRDPQEMFVELQGVIAGIGNEHLRALLQLVFADEDTARRYRIAPAAKQIHHAYLGGLIEHVLSICGLSRMVAAHYKNIDLDLLLAGAIVHDLGKIHELSYDRSFSYTDEGHLLGHMLIALRMLDDKFRALPNFPPRLRTLLQHMIVSHHGQLEFGSPKIPMFPEAMLLHQLDNLDAKMETMRSSIERDRHVEGNWTNYNSALERSVLKKARFLSDDSTPSPQPAPSENVAPQPAPPQPPSAQPLPKVDRPQAPKPLSPFAEMLQGALKKS